MLDEGEKTENGTAPVVGQLGLTPDDVTLVRQLPLFGAWGTTPDAAPGRCCGPHLPTRHDAFAQGEPADRFFVVLDGWVRLFRETSGGQDSTIAVFGRGESLAEAAILDAARYPVSASAASRARLLAIPAAGFLDQLRNDPGLALNLLASMSRHLHRLVRQVEQLTTRSSVERVADFLPHLCPAEAGRAEVEPPMDKAPTAAGSACSRRPCRARSPSSAWTAWRRQATGWSSRTCDGFAPARAAKASGPAFDRWSYPSVATRSRRPDAGGRPSPSSTRRTSPAAGTSRGSGSPVPTPPALPPTSATALGEGSLRR